MSDKGYYISSFFWSTLSKILTAIVGFITVPLLLGAYGKADYGIIAIATSCNGYMHLLDLGMNTGAVRFFSRWKAERKNGLVYSVARTNITFYILISIVNIIGLIALAIWGEPLFSVTHEQFLTLRSCLYIIALFSVFSWTTTAYNQLLIADKQMAFTMKWQSVLAILKGALIAVVLICKVSIETYFFLLTMLVAMLFLPYMYKCKRDGLIDSVKPGNDWRNFKVVLTFSLSLFVLSLFQTTATQSRPIILSMFATNGAETVTEFRIIEVVPSFIIMIGGVFSGIFLPKTSEMVAVNKQDEIEKFAYKWTTLTTILACILCFPFLLGSKETLTAYVGTEYTPLSVWMNLWIICTLCQIHSTPANALILAYGKTKPIVIYTSIACVVSMIINGILAPSYGVASAVIGYSVYIVFVLSSNYIYYYRKIMHLSLLKIAISFVIPSLYGIIGAIIVHMLFRNFTINMFENTRIDNIVMIGLKSVSWMALYTLLLVSTGTIKYKNRTIVTKYDNK